MLLIFTVVAVFRLLSVQMLLFVVFTLLFSLPSFCVVIRAVVDICCIIADVNGIVVVCARVAVFVVILYTVFYVANIAVDNAVVAVIACLYVVVVTGCVVWCLVLQLLCC